MAILNAIDGGLRAVKVFALANFLRDKRLGITGLGHFPNRNLGIAHMNANVIPIGISVNPIRHSYLRLVAPDNAVMDYTSTEGQAIVRLARQRNLDVFEQNGELNESKLAKTLSSKTRKIHQSTLTRLMAGTLAGKPQTLQNFADAFGLTLVEFMSLIRPATAAPISNSSALPQEAAELWQLWKRVPARQRDLFLEQIKSAADFAERYPELTVVINEPAAQAATEVRLARQRLRKSG